MPIKSAHKVTDGRRLRSEKSKQAIIDASKRLLEEGHLVPTAQMISDAAEVPIRSFFRHFPDMASLFRAVDASTQPKFDQTFSERVSRGSLTQRITSAIELRAETYEGSKSIIRSTKAQLWRYATLQDNYKRAQRRLRSDFEKRVPEFRELNSDSKEMVDSLASYEMWARLRDQQKLSVARSRKVIQQMIESIFAQLD